MISVIVPVYNAGHFLDALVQSILHQTYPDFELLLIDDGSTDGSGNTCDALAVIDHRIRVFHKENGGQSSARNLGLEQARGDLIAFADHDDILHPRMYETLVNAMEKAGAKVSACQFQNTADSDISGIDFSKPIEPTESVPQECVISRFFTPAWHIPVWNKLYRKELVQNLRFHHAMLGEDNLFSYRILKQCELIAFCPTALYFQRMHGNNFEFTGLRYMVDLIKAKQTILEDIKKCFPAEYRLGQKQYIYECVRIYNMYAARNNPELQAQTEESAELLRRELKSILGAKIPFAHKHKLLKFFVSGKRKIGEQIVL